MQKITLGQSVKIRNMVAAGESMASVAAQFGITETRVKDFCPEVKNENAKKRTKKRKKENEEAQEGNEENQES